MNSDSFFGTLGRDHVTVLYEQDVELQSQRGRLTQLHANCQQGETAFAITARTQGTLSEHSAISALRRLGVTPQVRDLLASHAASCR